MTEWVLDPTRRVAERLPSDVNKQVFCSLVDVEDLVPEQTEAGGALQSQLPQRQSSSVAVQHGVAQDEADCGESGEEGRVKMASGCVGMCLAE